jgi:hypothetical protein
VRRKGFDDVSRICGVLRPSGVVLSGVALSGVKRDHLIMVVRQPFAFYPDFSLRTFVHSNLNINCY